MGRGPTTWTAIAGATPVEVTRKRVRNLNLRVRRDGTVALSIPWRASPDDAQRFLDAHVGWIERAAARQSDGSEARDGCAGSAYPLWGRAVEGIDGTAPGPDELEGIWRAELERVVPEAARRLEPLVGAHASAWSLRSMSSRWGSCTPRSARIRLALRLAAYPPECLEYVMVHELTHLLEPSHNARFHELVARVVPNEREIAARLRRPPTDVPE